MKKIKCENCDERACAKITKGNDKGLFFCENCLDDWKGYVVDEMYEDLEE
jgi:hypothetical protein